MKRKGFSLLELMISLLIISSAVVTILPNLEASVRMTKKAKRIVTVSQLARNLLNEIQLEGKIKVDKKDGIFEDFKEFNWKYEIEKVELKDVMIHKKEGEGIPEGMSLERLFRIHLQIFAKEEEEAIYETWSFLFSEK